MNIHEWNTEVINDQWINFFILYIIKYNDSFSDEF